MGPQGSETPQSGHKPLPLERGFSEVGQAMIVVGLVLLTSAAALLFTAQSKLESSNEAVRQSTAALIQIADIENLVIGVDYSARGYALTGEYLFLDHEHQKQAALRKAVADLMGMVSPEQRPALENFDTLVEEHAAIYAALVDKGPKQVSETAAVITNPVLRKKRYDVLAALGRLKQGEQKILTARQAEAEQQLHQSAILTVVIVGLAFLGGMTDVVARLWRSHFRTEQRKKPLLSL